MDDIEKQQLRDYINFLLSKGYTKKEIHEKLIDKGFDSFLVRETIYPNLRLLVSAGIIFIIMILVIGGFFGYVMLKDKQIKFTFFGKDDKSNETSKILDTGQKENVLKINIENLVLDDGCIDAFEKYKQEGESIRSLVDLCFYRTSEYNKEACNEIVNENLRNSCKEERGLK